MTEPAIIVPADDFMAPPDPTTEALLAERRKDVDWHLAATAQTVAALDSAITGVTFNGLEATLLLLLGVRQARVQLATVEAALESRCARIMDTDVFEAPGIFAQRRGGASRKAWDNEAMVARVSHAIASQIALDTTTGEISDDRWETATTAITAYADTARPSWRTGALKAMGIRWDDLCTTEYGRHTVSVSAEDPQTL